MMIDGEVVDDCKAWRGQPKGGERRHRHTGRDLVVLKDATSWSSVGIEQDVVDADSNMVCERMVVGGCDGAMRVSLRRAVRL